eukprot:8115758-Alexandrium_andersonii.AAC.1
MAALDELGCSGRWTRRTPLGPPPPPPLARVARRPRRGKGRLRLLLLPPAQRTPRSRPPPWAL